jgi:hypothetical protein
MPTPSSNPPPEPPRPGAQAFPTCPEDATTRPPTTTTATSAEAASARSQTDDDDGNNGGSSSGSGGDANGDGHNNDINNDTNNNTNDNNNIAAPSPADSHSLRSATASPTPQEPATGPTTAATSPTSSSAADERDPETETTPKPKPASVALAQPPPLPLPQPQAHSPARQSAMRPTDDGWVREDDDSDEDAWWAADTSPPGFPCLRASAPAPSLLRAGSRYHGTQQSAHQRYDVHVEIQHVNLRDSFLCGYLKIQGMSSGVNVYSFTSSIVLAANFFRCRHRPDRGPPHAHDVFRGRNHWHQAHVHHQRLGRRRRDRHEPLEQV